MAALHTNQYTTLRPLKDTHILAEDILLLMELSFSARTFHPGNWFNPLRAAIDADIWLATGNQKLKDSIVLIQFKDCSGSNGTHWKPPEVENANVTQVMFCLVKYREFVKALFFSEQQKQKTFLGFWVTDVTENTALRRKKKSSTLLNRPKPTTRDGQSSASAHYHCGKHFLCSCLSRRTISKVVASRVSWFSVYSP